MGCLTDFGQDVIDGLRQADDLCLNAIHDAVSSISGCDGVIYTTGVGKSAFVAMRAASVLSNLGFHAVYLDPVEAAHGGIGRCSWDDLIICFSKSSETAELVRLIPVIRYRDLDLIVVTCNSLGSLALVAETVIDLGPLTEAGPYGVIPTTSCVAMTIVSDRIAFAAALRCGFTEESVSANHPGGNCGASIRAQPNGEGAESTETQGDGATV